MGKIAVRDKYVVRSQEQKEDFLIKHNENMMKIPYNKIEELMVGKSEFPIEDKFSNKKHYLIYFQWNPSIRQQVLF